MKTFHLLQWVLANEESVITCFYILATLAVMYDGRKSSVQKWGSVAGFTLVFLLVFRPIELRYSSYFLYITVTLGFAVLYSLCFCRKKLFYSLILCAYLMYSVVTAKTAISTLDFFHQNAPEGAQGNTLFFATLYVIFVIYHVFFRRHVIDPKIRLSKRYWMMFITASLLLVVCAQWVNNTFVEQTSYSYFVPAASLALVLLMIYYMNYLLVRSYESNAETVFMNQKMALQMDAMKQSEAMIHQVRKERHELKNNYFYIQSLVKEQKFEELDHYINDELGQNFELMEEFRTGNHMVDYILTTKVAQARSYGIHVMTIALLPEDLAVSERDLCPVLLNLLDNAIEASRRESQKDIHIHIGMAKQYLSIQIKNLTSEDVLKENPELITSKKNKEYHGIGMKIVRQIVANYNGILDVKMDGSYFAVSILLPTGGKSVI